MTEPGKFEYHLCGDRTMDSYGIVMRQWLCASKAGQTSGWRLGADVEDIPITFCPFCGVELPEEPRL